jgi:hypothetical protein
MESIVPGYNRRILLYRVGKFYTTRLTFRVIDTKNPQPDCLIEDSIISRRRNEESNFSAPVGRKLQLDIYGIAEKV